MAAREKSPSRREKKKTPRRGKQGVPRRIRRLTPAQRERLRRDLGRRIGEARQAAGLTQQEVASSVRLTPSVVSKIERGERRLDPVELARFARLYGITIGELVR